MNIRRMVDILLTKASQNHKVVYFETRTYKDDKVFKNYKVKIDKKPAQEFNSLSGLLIFLKDWKWWKLPKLTDRQKKKIIADYVDNGNYSETARLNNVSDMTVKRLVENNEDVLKKVEQKKEENTQDMLSYLESKKEDKKRVIDLCFRALEDKLATPDMFTSVKDIVTVYGIIVDKDLKFMEMQNSKINNLEITKVDELLKEIKNASIKW